MLALSLSIVLDTGPLRSPGQISGNPDIRNPFGPTKLRGLYRRHEYLALALIWFVGWVSRTISGT